MNLNRKGMPLIHLLSKENKIKTELLNFSKPVYDPKTQISNYEMRGSGGFTTTSSRATDGTQPKNEADYVMDDN